MAVFKSLKSHYRKECLRYLDAHPGRVITTEVIAAFLGKAWLLSVTPVNVMAGFKKSGSYPLNPGAVHDRQLMPSKAFHPLPESQLPGNSGDSPTSPDSFGGSVSDASANSSCPPPFTAEQEDQYCRQYKEGYDLPDHAYIAWLAVRDPEITSPSSSTVTHQEVTSSPRSTATNLSGSCPEHSTEPKSSSDVSDTLSQILSLGYQGRESQLSQVKQLLSLTVRS